MRHGDGPQPVKPWSTEGLRHHLQLTIPLGDTFQCTGRGNGSRCDDNGHDGRAAGGTEPDQRQHDPAYGRNAEQDGDNRLHQPHGREGVTRHHAGDGADARRNGETGQGPDGALRQDREEIRPRRKHSDSREGLTRRRQDEGAINFMPGLPGGEKAENTRKPRPARPEIAAHPAKTFENAVHACYTR
ncbi:hypothetical protein D3C86_1662090 [compost metagenome]